jgi:hypothetical protein
MDGVVPVNVPFSREFNANPTSSLAVVQTGHGKASLGCRFMRSPVHSRIAVTSEGEFQGQLDQARIVHG